jgi:hypothetical protein
VNTKLLRLCNRKSPYNNFPVSFLAFLVGQWICNLCLFGSDKDNNITYIQIPARIKIQIVVETDCYNNYPINLSYTLSMTVRTESYIASESGSIFFMVLSSPRYLIKKF